MEEDFKIVQKSVEDYTFTKFQKFYWGKKELSYEQQQFLNEIVNEFKLSC